ncbi:MAG TPA: adenylyltransferase/cytidyltransferase family protein [Methylophilus sp.]|jgi:glycerol-3-phosphate cytidylyltransferase|uniref:adenylyltransferase/cytidyltransferase family protein n=1 Tax=Methylophilus sp. TaxID=29541 RepID=UPI002C874652|nr:adenylyltransferase/cytidyltransferase family protein [Methylophilus sp.]HSH87828.1 adenylyltransferase/cytidyltransferase family protein [Methylophilus sp.]
MSVQKRIMVDMSATLIHHGHVRLLKAAKQLGHVIVALTTDEEIRSKKGYEPELDYAARAEVLLAMRDVDEVVPSPWLLDEAFLQQHNIDLLVHGHDNSNPIAAEKLYILPRTEGISSTQLRARVLKAVSQKMEANS